MSLPVKQHIIPKVLLKNFCCKPPLTYCIVNENGYLKNVSINSYPISKNIYTFEHLEGEAAFTLEKDYSKIESDFNKYYSIYKRCCVEHHLNSKGEVKFPPDMVEYFVGFIWMIFFRTKSYSNFSSNLLRTMEKDIKKIIDRSSLVKTKESIIKEAHLNGVLELTMYHSHKLIHLFPCVHIVKFKEKIVISDNPVILLNKNKEHVKTLKGNFFNNCDYILLPIDEHSIFILSKEKINKNFISPKQFNYYQLNNSDNYIFSSDKNGLTELNNVIKSKKEIQK